MKRFVAPALVLFLSSPLLAVTSINTLPAWDGVQFISSFGIPNTQTYGQTVTVDAFGGGGILESFSFEIGNCTVPITFRGHVYAFNGTNAVGPSLFDGPPQVVPANPGVFQLVTITTGSVALPPGNYVLFVSTSEDVGANVACRFGSVADNTAYGGGQFVFINNGANAALWTSSAWSTIASDLAMQVVFQATIPTLSEGALALLAAGLMAFALRRLRAKRAGGSITP